MKKLTVSLLTAIALQSALGDSVTFPYTVSNRPTDYYVPVTLPRFNPAWGKLTGISIIVQFSNHRKATITNFSRDPRHYEIYYNDNVTLWWPDGTLAFSEFHDESAQGTLPAVGGYTAELTNGGNLGFNICDPGFSYSVTSSKVGGWVGSGNITFYTGQDATINTEGTDFSAGIGSELITEGWTTVKVTYTYITNQTGVAMPCQ